MCHVFLLEFEKATALASFGDISPNLLMCRVSLLEFETATSKNSGSWYLEMLSLTPSLCRKLEMVRLVHMVSGRPISVYRDPCTPINLLFSTRGQLVRLSVVVTGHVFLYISDLILAMKCLMRSLATQLHATTQTW